MPHISDSEIPNYVSYRENFLNLAAKSELQSYRKKISGSGWSQEELSQDFAYLNQDSEMTLVHISGIHGIEGYLGSLIQDKILSTLGAGLRDCKINLIFLHAVNPFGMSWYRRVNSNNVDLNRNGFPANEAPSNRHFSGFTNFLNSTSRMDLLKKLPALLSQAQKIGLRQSSQTIAGGQWQFPESIFYGGKQTQEELLDLPKLLLQLAPETKSFYIIDVHTGLGSYGYDSLLVSDKSHLDFFRQSFDEGDDSSHVVNTAPKTNGLIYESIGTVEQWLKSELKNQQVKYVTQEFGTRFVGQVLMSLILENSLYLKDPKSPQRREILLNAFYPEAAHWRMQCRHQGLLRFSQLLDGIQETEKPPKPAEG